SFRVGEAALSSGAQRQLQALEKTGRKPGDPGVDKETRGWNADGGVTFAQRGKEEASDYRSFPDPNLVPVTVSTYRIDQIPQRVCELPAGRRSRFEEQFGLSEYDDSVIINQGRAVAGYFETVATACGDGKQSANWVTQK